MRLVEYISNSSENYVAMRTMQDRLNMFVKMVSEMECRYGMYKDGKISWDIYEHTVREAEECIWPFAFMCSDVAEIKNTETHSERIKYIRNFLVTLSEEDVQWELKKLA